MSERVKAGEATPGPWFVGDLEYQAIVHGTPGGFVIYRGSPPFAKADARLIAAAPDLLEALKGLVEYTDSEKVDWLAVTEKAHAAIAKAEGRDV